MRPHLDYGDIIYHKYDPEFKLDFSKRLESTQYSAALSVSGAWRRTTKTKFRKNLTGKSFIIGDSTDVHVTFINCKVTKDHYTSITKYHMNVLSVTNYDDQTRLSDLQKALTDLHLFPKLC